MAEANPISPSSRYRSSDGHSQFHDWLEESIRCGLKNVLGESGMQAVTFHIGSSRFEDPAEFHNQLLDLFHIGAVYLEKMIAKDLFHKLDIPFDNSDDFDFLEMINQAKELYGVKSLEG